MMNIENLQSERDRLISTLVRFVIAASTCGIHISLEMHTGKKRRTGRINGYIYGDGKPAPLLRTKFDIRAFGADGISLGVPLFIKEDPQKTGQENLERAEDENDTLRNAIAYLEMAVSRSSNGVKSPAA